MESPPTRKKTLARFDSDVNTADEKVTIVGHTDDSRETVGGKTPRDIALGLAEKYGNSKANLKELFLFSCEAGTKKVQSGWLYDTVSESFAQELADELTLQGFSRDLIVYSVEPPEGAYSMRVSVTTQALGGTMGGVGQIEAFAYMNKETEEYERARLDNPNAEQPPNYNKQQIMQAEGQEEHEATFRRAATPFKSQGANPQQQNQAADVSERYLEDVLGRRGIFKNFMLSFFPVLGDQFAHRLAAATTKEHKAIARIEALKANILPAVKEKIGSSSSFGGSKRRWKDLKDYLDKSQAPLVKKRHSWTNLSQHRTHFLGEKNIKMLNGEDEKLYSYKTVYEELERCHNYLKEVALDRMQIKTDIRKTIDEYLEIHKNDRDNVHQAKIAVMKALKAYISKPSPATWGHVETATAVPGWDRGLFSQVSKVHEEITSLKMTHGL